MTAQIKPMFEPTSEEQVCLLEQKLKAALPADYREFLLAHNGGSAKPNVFHISPAQKDSMLSILFGITGKKAYDLWTNALEAWEDLERTYLPIGEDPGGNQIYLSLAPKSYGHVYFRDHEAPAPEGLHPIAASFTDLLEKLHEQA